MQTKSVLRPFGEIDRQQTQAHLQAVLKDIQEQGVPKTPRIDPPTLLESFLDVETIEVPVLKRPPVTEKLSTLHQRTDFESWIDLRIFEYHEEHHRYPSVIWMSSIRKLEYIVEQLERQESKVRWHEYVFRHTHGWIAIRLETKIMGYHEVQCE